MGFSWEALVSSVTSRCDREYLGQEGTRGLDSFALRAGLRTFRGKKKTGNEIQSGLPACLLLATEQGVLHLQSDRAYSSKAEAKNRDCMLKSLFPARARVWNRRNH